MGTLADYGRSRFRLTRYSLLGVPIARLADRGNRRNIIAMLVGGAAIEP